MDTLNMPGFTGAAALYHSSHHYRVFSGQQKVEADIVVSAARIRQLPRVGREIPDEIFEPELPEVANAEFDVRCKNRIYTISTGAGGDCKLNIDTNDGSIKGGSCDDNKGNYAEVYCGSHQGEGTCLTAGGKGKCSEKT